MSEWTAASWQAFLDKGGGSKQPGWIPPSLHGSPSAQRWFKRHEEYLGTAADVAMLVALIKLKGKVIQTAGKYLWIYPTTAFLSGLLTILATERFVGDKQAEELSKWYASAVTDPYAWHVETDRVVQGAAHALIDDFTEGVTTSPAVAADMGTSAWDWIYWDRIGAWREVGSML